MGLFEKIFGRRKKAEQASEKIVMMNPNDIWFTTPTISNEFPRLVPKTKETPFDIFIQEDDYRANEFLNLSSLHQIQQEFNGIKEVWTNHSKKSGEVTLFKTCHVRKTIGSPGLNINFSELKTLLKCSQSGQVVINGSILVNGFAIKTENTTYFGTLDDETVIELCVFEWNDSTTGEILKIGETFNVLFVNWYNCDLLRND